MLYYQNSNFFYTNEFEKIMKIYIIWLIGVVIWNFGVPNATPLEDVIVAIVLSFFSIIMKKYFKL